jgi:hypothetical protein
MDGTRRKPARGGGALLALAIMIGAAAGLYVRQPALGMVAGLAIGLVLLALVWLLDRR